MNNCLADLSRLLPVAYMKKGRGRIEKTEIIEMTIKHMKHLQVHACKEMGKPSDDEDDLTVFRNGRSELFNEIKHVSCRNVRDRCPNGAAA